MANDKLLTFMNLKGVGRKQLSVQANISPSTLNRIINGEIQKVKMIQMEAIADALGTTIYSIFDIPLDMPLSMAVKPEEAGASVEKLLNPAESLLLYYYQNSYHEGKAAIMNRAKSEYYQTQSAILQKSNHTAIPADSHNQEVEEYSQISLSLEELGRDFL
ncbi:MAG: helix-turn-helix domain-containing protein [Lachnospiraceae bacterium]